MGKGAFGKVRIVERKDTGLTFALKYIRKDEGAFGEKDNFFYPGSEPLMYGNFKWFGRRAFGILSGNGGCSSI